MNTTSGITLDAQALVAGSAGNVARQRDHVAGLGAPRRALGHQPGADEGGAEEESDDDFRTRIIGEYLGTSGGGNVTDYRRWSTSQGIVRVTVVPVWQWPRHRAGDRDAGRRRRRLRATVVTALQQLPGPGAGAGPGPGAGRRYGDRRHLDAAADRDRRPVDGENGYTLDGIGNTIATRQAILDSLAAYLQGLQPGDTLVYQHLQAAFFVTGVHKVTA